jgi:predicted DNA-binding transcriptional regulator AlpA
MANKSRKSETSNDVPRGVLRTSEAARYLSCSEILLKKWRNKAPDDPGEKGPPCISVTPRLVVYRISELDAWLNSRARRGTQESVAA